MPNHKKPATPPGFDERLADIEGKIASSWALKTCAEYETEFRDHIKYELLNYATKLGISAMVILSGAGYLFIKSAITDVYAEKKKEIIGDLKAKYELNLAAEQRRFEWRRHHDYGKNYIYLAKFYYESNINDASKKNNIIGDQFLRARTYFDYAIRADPEQATTYWELGELYYTYAKDYEQQNWIDKHRALHYYIQATKLFTDSEVMKGWRADAYRVSGQICLELAKSDSKNDRDQCGITKIIEYLNTARNEYAKAISESRDYNALRIKDVDDLFVKIANGIEK